VYECYGIEATAFSSWSIGSFDSLMEDLVLMKYDYHVLFILYYAHQL